MERSKVGLVRSSGGRLYFHHQQSNPYVRLIKSRHAKKSERTRQKIVEAANRLFYHKGYNQTSFSDVVDAAGVPRGNIYYYFKTKDEILEAAIKHRTERITQMLEGWTGSYRTPIDRLHRFIDILSNSADAIMRYGCPMGTLNTELGRIRRTAGAGGKSVQGI